MQDFVYLIEAHYGALDMSYDHRIGCCISIYEAAHLVRKLYAYAEWHEEATRPIVVVPDDADFETIVAAEEEEAALWEMASKAKIYQLGLTDLENIIDLFNVVEYNPDITFSLTGVALLPKVAPGAVA